MTTHPSARPLLTVKQQIPPVRAGAVQRDRLERQLRAAHTDLTIVVAPAGWGKTSLLSAWASEPGEQVRVAWVSLDENDDEPIRFWTYVLTALRRASADISPAAVAALAVSGAGPIDLAVPILLNELSSTSIPHVLVLDDFHVLTDRGIHESVEFFVSYLPTSARLVVASRSDPPLPIARLRARGKLTELRADDLRLTPEEAATLVSRVSGKDLAGAELAELWTRTEGWAAGLQLAGLARRAHQEPGAPRVRGDERHLLDYFTAEVLPFITAEQRDLLVRAAPLERLSGPLCDAALQVTGSEAVLAALDRADLFLVALDADNEWYRCHHLFRDVLLREPEARSESSTREMLRRAADWFDEHGRIEDAVRHMLRAGDSAAATDKLETSEPWFLEHGEAAAFLRLGNLLPAEQVRPQLALGLAYAAATTGHHEHVARWLDICDQHIGPDTVVQGWDDPRAAALMLRALIGIPDSESARSVSLCQQAVALEPENAHGHRIALGALGGALARDGRFAEAVEILSQTWQQRDQISWSPGVNLQIAGSLGLCLLELGRDSELDILLFEAAPMADGAERNWADAAGPLVALLRVVQGRNHYRRGDVAAAHTLLTRAARVAEVANLSSSLVLALVFLADAELGRGDRAAAKAALTRAAEQVDNEPVASFAVRRLRESEARIGRVAVRSARRSGALAEELTDRELSILRVLPGSASQREIGQAMFLSVNTVKAYNKSLYRKLGVASRQDAVATARELGLI